MSTSDSFNKARSLCHEYGAAQKLTSIVIGWSDRVPSDGSVSSCP